jgi:hypothetical protein
VQIEILEYRTLEPGNRGRSVSYFTLRIIIILIETIKDLYNQGAAIWTYSNPPRLQATRAGGKPGNRTWRCFRSGRNKRSAPWVRS